MMYTLSRAQQAESVNALRHQGVKPVDMHVLECYFKETYTCEEQAELSGASSLSPSLSILAMLSGCNPPYGSLPPLNTSQQVTPNDHCIQPLVTAVLLIVTACQLTTSVFSVKMASSKLSMAIHLIGSFTGASLSCLK